MTSMPGSSRTRSSAAMSAREISAPVASPPAWAIRSRWWPPSRVSAISPPASRSNSAPSATSSRTRVGPLGDERAHRVDVAQPDPGDERVVRGARRACPRGRRAAAMPPCAHSRRARGEHGLGHEQHPVDPLAQPQGAGQPGDARADDDDVGARRPPGRGRSEATGQRHGGGRHAGPSLRRPRGRAGTSEKTSSAPPPGPTSSGVLSMRRVVPTRAATASSASPRYHSGTSASVSGCTSTR